MPSVAIQKLLDDHPQHHNGTKKYQLLPGPSDTVKDEESITTDFDVGESTLIPNYQPYALPPNAKPIQTVLTEDLKTPDNHVPRDPRLIRLTGIHPFNVEAPLTDLWDEGFITTKDLHYVRNHGAVPLVHDEEVLDWRFTVEGLVENPLSMTLGDLLEEFEQVTYPVTLVCAGNRRKEQNMVRKTKGFSWGAAGLSTALWTGVPLDLLLAKAKPIVRGGGGGRRRGARYVCFEGADKLPNGYYGTSIKLNWAMDPNRGVLVAHGMNGEMLPPDHGKPLRIIIPGQIGGRSVKWLRRIIVTEAPSENWYHIYDNRVLPTTISPEASADLPDTWKDEKYAIYDLNTNSVIAKPAHNERVTITDGHGHGHDHGAKVYKFQGYAYAGGGRRVTRVEITLDRGRSWRLADISYPEDDYRLAPEGERLFGGRLDMDWRETCFCWCFWSLDIAINDLIIGEKKEGKEGLTCTGDIMVRAMDEGVMVQPRDMYWSVLGMMNNPWYRVVVHHEGGKLWFEHPTQPALMAGGWMERIKKEGGDLSNGYWGERMPGEAEGGGGGGGGRIPPPQPVKEIIMVNKHVDKEIGLEEVKKHDGETEPWFILDGEVYDGTKFLEGHPGGTTSIIGAAGQDVTEEFMAIRKKLLSPLPPPHFLGPFHNSHTPLPPTDSENAKAMMPSYHIGTLNAASKKLLLTSPESGHATADSSTEPPRPVFLHPKTWRRALLTAKTVISHDTNIFSFTLDHADQSIGLPTGQHLLLRLRDPVTREVLIRAYTPYSDGAVEKGKLDVLVKIYRAGTDDRYPGGGAMTQALDSIPLGHWVEFKGPVGKFEYLGRGRCKISGGGGGGGGGRERMIKRFIMVCAGSGITPIFAVLREVFKDPLDETSCTVLDGNRCEEDILCRAEIEELVREGGGGGDSGGGGKEEKEGRRRRRTRCKVVHTLSQPGPGWTGGKGRMDRVLFEKEVGPPKNKEAGGDELVLVCGPESMVKSVRDIFTGMGWKEEDILFF